MSIDIVQATIDHVRSMANYYEDKEEEAAKIERRLLWRGKKQAAESFLSYLKKCKLRAIREAQGNEA